MQEILDFIAANPMIKKVAFLVLGLLIVRIFLFYLKKNIFSKIKNNDNQYKAKKISNFLSFALILLLISIVFKDELGGFTIAFGVIGAGIAFALQEVIMSFAGWVAIILGEFYKPGDRIQLGGTKGDVMDIGVLRTTIMETGQWVEGDLYNGRIVFIANSFVFKEPVYNYSGDFPFLWDEIKIPIKYGSNYAKAKEIILASGVKVVGDLPQESLKKWSYLQSKYRLEDAQTNPMVTIIANDNWVECTLRYVVDFKRRRKVKDALFLAILENIDATNGEIQFASATFELVGLPKVDINLHSK